MARKKRHGKLAKSCLDCGYVREEALEEVDRLPAWKVKLLAALAITHHDSFFSDNTRDLVRGCTEVLKRDYYWNNPT